MPAGYRHIGPGGELTLFQHVPADVCQQCGERYYDAETVEQMDELRQRVRPEQTVAVPVFDLSGSPVPARA
ncbi:MAG TPA: YgiT-type zinc finger protein [Chloroflexota bacterium]|nr:YgiT-type zinc finger protein [Chloroflexota bacterium]